MSCPVSYPEYPEDPEASLMFLAEFRWPRTSTISPPALVKRAPALGMAALGGHRSAQG